MRVGDLLAGTWVISAPQAQLTVDLLEQPGRARRTTASPTRSSTSTACSSCRRWSRCCATATREAIATVAAAIRTKIGLPTTAAHDYDFLARLLRRRPGRGWSAACCSASARTSTTNSIRAVQSLSAAGSVSGARRSARPRRTAPDRPRRPTRRHCRRPAPGREAPMIAEATLGSRSTQASANWARLSPASAASGLSRSTASSTGGCSQRCHPAAHLLAGRAAARPAAARRAHICRSARLGRAATRRSAKCRWRRRAGSPPSRARARAANIAAGWRRSGRRPAMSIAALILSAGHSEKPI